MRSAQTFLTAGFWFLCAVMIAPAGAQTDSSTKVRVGAYPAWTNVARGSVVPIAVLLDHEPRWHTHTNAPKLPADLEFMAESIIATSIEVSVDGAAASFDAAQIQWPQPTEVQIEWGGEPLPYECYEHRAIAFVPIRIRNDAPDGPLNVSITVRFQACDDAQCLAPATVDQNVALQVVASEHAGSMADASVIFSGYDGPAGGDATAASSNDSGGGLAVLWIVIVAVVIAVIGGAIGIILLRR